MSSNLEDQSCVLEVEESVNLSLGPHHSPLKFPEPVFGNGASPDSLRRHPIEKSTPVGVGVTSIVPSHGASRPIYESGRVSSAPAVLIMPDQVHGKPSILSRMKSILPSFWTSRPRQSSQEEEEYALKEHQYTLIIPLECDDLLVFNLEAQLGKGQDPAVKVLRFRCNAMPAGRFKEIHLSVRLSDPDAPISKGSTILSPRKNPRIVEYEPRDIKLIRGVEVEHGHGQEISANLSGGAFGAAGGASATKTYDMHYTQMEGAEVCGVYRLKDQSEVHWTWTASKLPGAVLKGTCEFSVTVENMKETVKADFRVVCKMEKGITNLLQSDVEAPKKQKPKIDHVVAKLSFTGGHQA